MTNRFSTPSKIFFSLPTQPLAPLSITHTNPHGFRRPYTGGMETPEELLTDQLATCLAAMQDCLSQSRTPHPDGKFGHLRRHDLRYVAKLMKASALLTGSLARLKGDSRLHVHVTREGGYAKLDKGGG